MIQPAIVIIDDLPQVLQKLEGESLWIGKLPPIMYTMGQLLSTWRNIYTPGAKLASTEGMEQPRRQATGRVIRRGEGGVDEWSGPLWTQSGGLCGPPSLHLPPDCLIGPGDVACAGDHKGPPRTAPPPSPLRILMDCFLG
jgi:hypothetical protein